MNKTFNIGKRTVGEGCKPFIIAELSGNHQQSYEMAIKMIESAARAGADAVKLQTYTADTMTLDIAKGEFVINEKDSLWHGSSLHSLYEKAATPWEWHKRLFDRASELGLIAFSSPFDESSVDFLETLNVPCYKIASFENTDLPLIKRVAKTGKPIIMSTGMATLSDIESAVDVAVTAGCRDLILLKCTSTYPAPPNDSNLITIPHMASTFDCPVGLSDHSNGIGVALASVGLGATVIEKHFVLDRSMGGVDAEFSLEPDELKQLVNEVHRASEAVGRICYGKTGSDDKARPYRRSLYISQDVNKGDILKEEHVRIVRPGAGLSPSHYHNVIGMTVSSDVKKGTPISWSLFK